MVIQILVSLFIVFAASRVILRYRDGSIGIFGTIVWGVLWAFVAIFAWVPNITSTIAHMIGVGRGVDALVYISIVALFYGVFRLYVKLEFVEHELTSLVRALAIREKQK